jgi:hypothetical protein
MSEVTIKRICNPGWKNCERPELRERIAELEAKIAEFIWGEENPGEYQLQEERIAELELQQGHPHTKNCQCVLCQPLGRQCNCKTCKRITELEAERDSHAIANVNANCTITELEAENKLVSKWKGSWEKDQATITELEEANAELRRDANVR